MADGNMSVEAQTAPPESSRVTSVKKLPRRVVKAAPREVPTTTFPYVDQDAAIGVARALLDQGGVALTRDQLAAALKLAPGSGGFAWKLGAARQYGLIQQKDGARISLTDLGFAITEADAARQKQARAVSFLTVPLYKRVYDEFKGKQLPPRPNGLEQAFVRFGVSPKQKDKARFAFERAAKQAGFFEHGNERLVEPIGIDDAVAPAPTAAKSEQVSTSRAPVKELVSATGEKLHPFIEGLLKELPEPYSAWSTTDRAKWIRAAQDIFELIYVSKEGAETELPLSAMLSVSGKSE
jgi:hypothetical protein